ncbi:NAD(P)-dependent alcohol dehydrogenase [Actinosynnema sp. NPDC050436]|uniref:NAD(P)-dependent alcohol dehydrogenase n=1 Tax=Actinosynnema sp. NPDC050436 TaxID=3155659 RepID=UPI0033D8D77A
MRAIRYAAYGPPDVLKVLEVDPPVPGPHDVLVRVRAASINPLDDHYLRGTPYLARAATGLFQPKGGLGADLSGQVESVGRAVTRFQPGDEVFGGRGTSTDDRSAAFAQYACFREDAVLLVKPAGLTFEQAAAVPVAALTALQGLRDAGRLRDGQSVLVNGAAGGVGTFAVQVAKALGAGVTAVCGTGNVELVRALGADRVVDYTAEDFTASGRYDLVLDMIGNRTFAEFRRILAPRGALVAVGRAVARDQLVSPVLRPVGMAVVSAFVSERLVPFLCRNRRDDLVTVRDLLESGHVRPVVDRTYPLERAREALAYFERGHVRGKVVLTV